MDKMTAAELGADRFDTLIACQALLGEPIGIAGEGELPDLVRPGLEMLRHMAQRDPKWARIVLDIMKGKREMPRDMDPADDDPVAATAWHVRGALIVAAAGSVPNFDDDDRRILGEILMTADDVYDSVLERISGGCLTPATKTELFVQPLRAILEKK